MKRSQFSVAESPSPIHKRLRMSPSNTSEDLSHTEDAEGEWTKVEKRKEKKVKKVQAKLDANPPRFMYYKGEIVKRREAVGIADFRDFVLHLVADAPPPSWVRIENPRSVQKVVVLLIPGLTPSLLSLPPLPTSATSNPNLPLAIPFPPNTDEPLPFIANKFSHACPTRAPGEQTKMYSVLSAFFQAPVTGEEKKRKLLERLACKNIPDYKGSKLTISVVVERTQEKTPSRYELSLEQMIENEYPIPSYMADIFEKPSDWIEIPNLTSEKSSKVYAIDCEMCLTEDGKELARVCLIDYHLGTVVYDQLVKPCKPVIDYLTRWSGITEEALNSVTTTFAEVQAQIKTFLSEVPTPVLAGHSLESDLKALKICHPRCIDTAVIYHHPRGRPLKPGLAWLTKKWCGREIQNRGEGGHDPEEDARACLDLVRKKVENGAGFGEFKTDQESIFERISRSTRVVRTAVVDYGTPASWHGSKATATVACTTDEEIFEGLLEVIPGNNFIFGRFTELANASGWITSKSTNHTGMPGLLGTDAPSPVLSLSVDDAVSNLNSRLTRLYEALPTRTAFIIFTGHSDPRGMTALNARKVLFENALRMGSTEAVDEAVRGHSWKTQDERDLEEEVEKAKRGLLFLSVKDGK